jgi:protein-tyrosine phosphatase
MKENQENQPSTAMHKMIDTHIHVLPCVDDGAGSMEEAVQMIALGVREGIETFFCTPHSRFITDARTEKYCEDQMRRLTDACHRAGSPTFGMSLACEVNFTPDTLEQNLANLRRKRYRTLGDTEYVLTEFCFHETSDVIRPVCARLLREGYTPVIAHVERYKCTPQEVKELREMGCRIQINVSSITEEAFLADNNVARELVRNRCVDVLGTDAHAIDWRPPVVQHGLEVLYAMLDRQEADRIACQNAAECFQCESP